MNALKKATALLLLIGFFGVLSSPRCHGGQVAPAAVGWGNLFVPGLGETLRGHPVNGLLESSLTIGTYYGGTFYAKEGAFTIDGSVLVPSGQNIVKPLLGEVMQEFALKYHMWNTFFNYQQASLDPSQSSRQKEYQQPLYMGDWKDVLLAPFKWKNLREPWVFVPILAAGSYLYFEYKHAPVVPQGYRSRPGEEALYDFSQGVAVPLGSSFGEEVLFRGFIQREMRYYTNSIPLSIATETLLFTVIHAPDLRLGAFVGGLYFGLAVNHFDGNLEPGIASHFWIDFVSGMFVDLLFRRVQGKSVPFSASVQIPI